MARQLRVGEVLLAIEGLALARHVFGDDARAVGARVEGIRSALDALDAPPDRPDAPTEPIERLAVALEEVDVATGYDRWAASYDDAENPLIAIEQPVLHSLLRPIAPGRALDVACGTGRVTALLRSLGHDVTGVDVNEAMLSRARFNVPQARFVRAAIGDPVTLEAPAGGFDLVVCALALTHLASLDSAVMWLAHLTRPGGRVVLSDAHPASVFLGGHAIFHDDDGVTRLVRNHVHLMSAYLRAFAATGLSVRACVERALRADEGAMAGLAGRLRADATQAAFVGLPFVLAWDLERTGTAASHEQHE